jgi:hypothetical protein
MFAVDRVSGALIYQRDVWYRRFAGLLERKARDHKIPARRFSNTPHPPREVIAARLSPPLFLYTCRVIMRRSRVRKGSLGARH